MKDYTKYDFAAIVGAEVEIVLEEAKEPLIAKIIGYNPKTKWVHVIILEPHPCFWLGGRPESLDCSDIHGLSAKIKVEDMSVKQLKRVILDEDLNDVVVFSGDAIDEHFQTDDLILSLDYIHRPFTDYIDCTDWGW